MRDLPGTDGQENGSSAARGAPRSAASLSMKWSRRQSNRPRAAARGPMASHLRASSGRSARSTLPGRREARATRASWRPPLLGSPLNLPPCRFGPRRPTVPWLIDTERAAAGQRQLGQHTPTDAAGRSTRQALLRHRADEGIEVVHRQVELVNAVLVSGVDGHLRRRQRKYQPAVPGVHVRQAEDVAEEPRSASGFLL